MSHNDIVCHRIAISRAEFFNTYVSTSILRVALWEMARNTDNRKAATSVMRVWGATNLKDASADASLREWALMDCEHNNEGWGCVFWNWHLCNTKPGPTHLPSRHHCFVCGSHNHGAKGTIQSPQPGECAKITEYRTELQHVATRTGLEVKDVLQMFGFGIPEKLAQMITITILAPATKASAWEHPPRIARGGEPATLTPTPEGGPLSWAAQSDATNTDGSEADGEADGETEEPHVSLKSAMRAHAEAKKKAELTHVPPGYKLVKITKKEKTHGK